MADKLNKRSKDESFVNAYDSLYPFVMKYCTARANGNIQLAEDCTQDAFFVLYKKHCDGVVIENPKAFLCRTCDNILLNRKTKIIKEESRRADEELLNQVTIDDGIFDELEYEELLNRIKSLLDKTDWKLFYMRYVDDLSIKEISEKADMSITSITTRLSRIRKKLQAVLKDY